MDSDDIDIADIDIALSYNIEFVEFLHYILEYFSQEENPLV